VGTFLSRREKHRIEKKASLTEEKKKIKIFGSKTLERAISRSLSGNVPANFAEKGWNFFFQIKLGQCKIFKKFISL